jgi:molecular chaperone DnaK (HSP70)
MAVIIPKNSKLPIERTQRFYTAKDFQTFVSIQIFEGENIRIANLNRLLGYFIIDGLPMKPAGQEHVDVTIRIDKEGILHVRGVTSRKSANITIKDHRGRIAAEELEALKSQLC